MVHARVFGMVLQVVQHPRKRGALEVGALLVGHERRDQLAALEHEFFHPQQLGDPAQADGAQQLLRFLRQGPEPVLQPVAEALHFLRVGQVVQLAVQRNPFWDVAHVVVWNEQRQVRLQRGFFHVLPALRLLGLHQVFELLLFQFLHRFCEDALVHVEAQIVDEPALFRPEQVARPADVQVAHGNLHARPEVGELFERLQSLA